MVIQNKINFNIIKQYLLGPFTKHQSTQICCPKMSVLLSPSRARDASLYDSYSTNA